MILYPELHCGQFWRSVVCPLEFLDIIGSFHERVYAGVWVSADVSVQEWLEARVYNGHSL